MYIIFLYLYISVGVTATYASVSRLPSGGSTSGTGTLCATRIRQGSGQCYDMCICDICTVV